MWARHQAPARSSMIRSTDDPESARIQRPSRITPFYVSADTSAIGRCLRRMRGGGRQLWSAPLKSRGSDEPRTIQFGNPVRPREWFLVPLSVLDEAFHCIKDGTDQPLGCFGRALPDRFRNDVDACGRAVRRTRLRGLWNRLNRGVARMAFDDRESAADRTGLARCRARDRRRRRDCRRSLPMFGIFCPHRHQWRATTNATPNPCDVGGRARRVRTCRSVSLASPRRPHNIPQHTTEVCGLRWQNVTKYRGCSQVMWGAVSLPDPLAPDADVIRLQTRRYISILPASCDERCAVKRARTVDAIRRPSHRRCKRCPRRRGR